MEIEEIWEEAKEILVSDIDEDDPRLVFIDMLSPFGAFGDQFILVTSSEKVGNWVNNNYLTKIKAAILAVTNKEYTVNVTVKDSVYSSTDNQSQTQAPAQEQPTFAAPITTQTPVDQQPDWMREYYTSETPQRVSAPQQQQPVQPQHVNQSQQDSQQRGGKYSGLFAGRTFDSFVQGPSNKFAYSAAMAVAEQPGNMWNPLFIYGKSGLGKTHLLVAIANYINTNLPNMNVVYVDARDFLDDLSSAAQLNQWKAFNDKYQSADVLLVDDVQYLENKEGSIDMLFNIFNKMTGEFKQVVLSADRAPKDINMDERIRTRFIQGMLVDVQPPDYETRLAIIRNNYWKAQQTTTIGAAIPDEVLEYLAESATSNIRQMEGALNRLMGNITLFHKQSITVEEAREILQDFFPEVEAIPVDIATIQAEVEHFFKISHEDMVGSKRRKDLAQARHIAIYLSRYMTAESMQNIGKKFGGRDHTTVMHSVNKIEEEQSENRQLYDIIEQLRSRIQDHNC